MVETCFIALKRTESQKRSGNAIHTTHDLIMVWVFEFTKQKRLQSKYYRNEK